MALFPGSATGFHPDTRVLQSGYHRIRVDGRPNWIKKNSRFYAKMDVCGRDLYLAPVNNKPRELNTIFAP